VREARGLAASPHLPYTLKVEGKDSITIRRASASDAALLAELATKAYQPYLERMPGQRPGPMDADYAAAIARDTVWVAEVSDHVAGFLVLVDEPGATLLENVAVHPDWQGRGIGRLLMTMAEDHARATGTHVVRLYTHAVMVENQRLYSRSGYVEVERRSDDGFDRFFYEKSLS
jgi:ribosomal protein S18 acetylase RimI-like enzyme